MNSLAQELINEIINHVPTEDLPASSLVARRWRHRSQERYFECVRFYYDGSALWEMSIPQHPDGIPACVRHLWLELILPSLELDIFDRVLKTFRSMISLTIFRTRLVGPGPDRLAGLALLGEFGRGVTRLAFAHVYIYSFADVASLIFSLPNLKELVVNRVESTLCELPAVPPDTSRRGPLGSLIALGNPKDVLGALARRKVTSHTLSLNPSDEGLGELVISSSATVVELKLIDGHPAHQADVASPVVHQPSFPSLMRVRVEIFKWGLTKCLASFLSCIDSAPELSSVTFSLTGTGPTLQEFPSSGNWVTVDEWLARMVGMRGRVGNGLRVVLTGWPEDNTSWRKYLPKFRSAGGELRGETRDDDHWDPRVIMGASRWDNLGCHGTFADTYL